jgi:hypothetical protein
MMKTLMIASAALFALTAPMSGAFAAKRGGAGVGGHAHAASHAGGGRAHVASHAGNRGHVGAKVGSVRSRGNVRHAGNYGHRGYRNGVVGLAVGAGIYAAGSGDCGYYYRKWQATGSQYWRSRYDACTG